MIKTSAEEMQKFCAALFLENSETERDQLVEQFEDCLDMAAAIQSINEVRETGDIFDWDDFQKELDAME